MFIRSAALKHQPASRLTASKLPMDPIKRKRRAAILRITRKIHRTTGAILFAFFFVTAVTGLLLGWKKHTGGVILPKSYQGKSTESKDWLPTHVLLENANRIVRQQIDANLSLELERIDMRPDKGMVK